MKKILLTGLSTLALLLSLANCGKSSGSDGDAYRVDRYGRYTDRDVRRRLDDRGLDYQYYAGDGCDYYYIEDYCGGGCGGGWMYNDYDAMYGQAGIYVDARFKF